MSLSIDRASFGPWNARPTRVSAANNAASPAMAGDSLALTSARDLSQFSSYLEDQYTDGKSNGCGTTTLGMILSYLKGQPGAYSRAKIDGSIRRQDMASSPYNLADYARAQGMRTASRNNASLDDLTTMIDQGVPVLTMIEPSDPNDMVLHYVAVTGYTRGADGKVQDVTIANPAGGELQTLSVDEWTRKWGHLKLEGKSTGINNFMIAVAPKDDTPIRGKDGTVRKGSEIALPAEKDIGLVLKGLDVLADAANTGTAIASAARNVWDKATGWLPWA
jgi:predicted double-glycine peptidase